MSALVALDSAGPRIGVALLAGGEVSERLTEGGRGTERVLVRLVAELCDERGLVRSDLDAVAVSIGPGAFTGLRVGIATAGGLAQALGCGVVVVDSLTPRAHQAGLDGPLLVMLDARKQRVYAAAWQDTTQVREMADVPPEEALSWMVAPFRATGAGAVVYRDRVEEAGGTVVADPGHPGVGQLARIAEARRVDAVAPAQLAPRYLREPDAVVKKNTGR